MWGGHLGAGCAVGGGVREGWVGSTCAEHGCGGLGLRAGGGFVGKAVAGSDGDNIVCRS